MTSSHAATAIRVAVLGEWVPSQLIDVLALQRAEEPETTAVLVEYGAAGPAEMSSDGHIDFALSTTELKWPGWVCDPLWHDTLAVAVPKRSHLLAYREVQCHELLKQPIIYAQTTANEPWDVVAHRMLDDAPQRHRQRVGTFDMAMTLVAAGYGVGIAPSTRLASYQCRGIAIRPLAGAPAIVMAYLLYPGATLAEPHTRFIERVRSIS